MIKARQSIEVVSPEPIGGRNLAINSGRPGRDMSKPIGLGFDSGKGPSKYLTANFSVSQKIDLNTPYCVTIKLNNKATGRTRIGCFVNGGTYRIGEWQPLAQGEQVISWTGTLNGRMESATGETINFYAGPLDGVNGDLEIEWLKLEKGNTPTDWTPAPEDVESHISGEIASARTYSKQLADSITTGATDIIITDANGQKLSTLRDAHHTITTTSQELSVMQAGVGTILKQSAAGWAFDWQTAAGGRIEFQDGGVIKVGSNAQSVRISDDSVRIGKDTQYQLITDDETIFYSSGAGDTRITNAGLESKQVSALESLSIGGWKFLTTPDGDLIIA